MADSSYDYLVYGAHGFFGHSVVVALETAQMRFVCGNARIEDAAAVTAELNLYTPRRVISAAGLVASPNAVRVTR